LNRQWRQWPAGGPGGPGPFGPYNGTVQFLQGQWVHTVQVPKNPVVPNGVVIFASVRSSEAVLRGRKQLPSATFRHAARPRKPELSNNKEVGSDVMIGLAGTIGIDSPLPNWSVNCEASIPVKFGATVIVGMVIVKSDWEFAGFAASLLESRKSSSCDRSGVPH